MDRLIALCKRRGVIFPSSEIYGGITSSYDYGPIGAPMMANLARLWMEEMTLRHENIVQIDSAIIQNPKVWEASGHVAGFNDPLVECTNCKRRIRIDDYAKESYPRLLKNFERLASAFEPGQLIRPEDLAPESPERLYIEKIHAVIEWQAMTGREGSIPREDADALITEYMLKHYNQCNSCGTKGSLLPPRQFNLMLQTQIGASQDSASVAYLRPETAQGIYLNYKSVMTTMRLKPPFGIAQIGKAFRNEITTKNFIFRTREFEQMEMQFFIPPGENAKWLDYWKGERWNFYRSLEVNPAKLRWHEHEKLAHYARAAFDIEYEFPFGWSELEGLHDRGDFDLSQHQKVSGKDLTFFDDETRERYTPHVIETSAGLNRSLLMLLCDAYREDVQAGEERVYLAIAPRIAAVKAAFLPLVKKDGLFEIAEEMYRSLRAKVPVFFDESGSIGKRYRRMDEIGTPFCFTIDYQTKEDGTITVRWRDSLKQERIGKDRVGEFLAENLLTYMLQESK
ncbi:MAG: glycine--tRNA ligase [Calditrichaeota bacterium]|nr:glycine--tRNA ligase [Calditrichota bacterium]